MNDLILFLIGILLTLGTGMFVAAEFTLVNIDRADLEARRDRGEKGLERIIGALRQTATHLSSAQLGITLTTLLAGYTLEPALSSFMAPLFDLMHLPEPWAGTISSILAVIVATVLSMLFGELVPKNFALARPMVVARIVVPFQLVFTTIFKPAVILLNDTSNLVLHGFGIEPQEELSSARSAEELSSLVKRAALAGSLDSQTATLLTKTLDFSELTAGDVMTPRPSVQHVEAVDTAQDVIDLTRRTGFSRFPVIGRDGDDVLGLVHVKQAVGIERDQRSQVKVKALMVPIARVPETMSLDTLLGELRGRSLQMAVVVDEYGGTAGVVTLEDLVEELVGEVADEHDRLSLGAVRTRSGNWLLPGLLRADEMAEQVQVSFPEGSAYDTLGGFVMERLGRIPQPGDAVEEPGVGTFVVTVMDGRRVDRVRFAPAPLVEIAAAHERAQEGGDAR
ncbi:hemolysin family protein [Pseudoclavibacter sp. CFCC 13611]|uniref:hemolysin family protein n=1 Tax=Pseudoclavibacter sp. CFCC 13611 TaxID=2615178 RepID=UPI00130161D9|nr:hemolysin family protein [Pseudoclavibacter sp. CFCC 13611]KAB1664430.1 HlyC/CorC family transporter [Pseudoclavibacter sp. CFCC 13611]